MKLLSNLRFLVLTIFLITTSHVNAFSFPQYICGETLNVPSGYHVDSFVMHTNCPGTSSRNSTMYLKDEGPSFGQCGAYKSCPSGYTKIRTDYSYACSYNAFLPGREDNQSICVKD